MASPTGTLRLPFFVSIMHLSPTGFRAARMSVAFLWYLSPSLECRMQPLDSETGEAANS